MDHMKLSARQIRRAAGRTQLMVAAALNCSISLVRTYELNQVEGVADDIMRARFDAFYEDMARAGLARTEPSNAKRSSAA